MSSTKLAIISINIIWVILVRFLNQKLYRYSKSQKCLLIFLAFALSACQQQTDSTDDLKSQKHHQHGFIEVTSFGEQTAIPSVDFEISADPVNGWNIHIKTDNFIFAPEHANQAAVAGEGHAHIFIDGFKFYRLYGPWLHLKNLTSGQHTVTITLNANDHSTWTHDGQKISASRTIFQQ